MVPARWLEQGQVIEDQQTLGGQGPSDPTLGQGGIATSWWQWTGLVNSVQVWHDQAPTKRSSGQPNAQGRAYGRRRKLRSVAVHRAAVVPDELPRVMTIGSLVPGSICIEGTPPPSHGICSRCICNPAWLVQSAGFQTLPMHGARERTVWQSPAGVRSGDYRDVIRRGSFVPEGVAEGRGKSKKRRSTLTVSLPLPRGSYQRGQTADCGPDYSHMCGVLSTEHWY